MFSLLWRFLPGPAWLRLVILLLVAAAAVWAVVTFVYPYVAELMPAPGADVVVE